MAAGTLAENAADSDRGADLDDMLGHAEARRFVLRAIETGRVPQAILIAGPRGVGKKSLAWAAIKRMVAPAERGAGNAAGKVARGTHPDVRAIGAAGFSGQIVVDTIRETEDWLPTAPLEAPVKVALIAPAERMNLAAANALLKLLEEPPPHGRFILVAEDPARLLPTIRSRCTPIVLDPIDSESLAAWIAARAPAAAGRAAAIARMAEGCPGRALELAAEDTVSGRAEILSELRLLREHGFAVVFRVADRLASLRGDPADAMRLALGLLRDALALKLGSDAILNEDLASELRALADGATVEGLHGACEALAEAQGEAAGFYSPQAQAHFLETLTVRVGQALRSR